MNHYATATLERANKAGTNFQLGICKQILSPFVGCGEAIALTHPSYLMFVLALNLLSPLTDDGESCALASGFCTQMLA
ncbi:MAG TPA: hypothetical protein V6C88_10515 [Chroococcidiopsis sp.]